MAGGVDGSAGGVTLYRTIVADPPWRYGTRTPTSTAKARRAAADAHYATMTVEDICAIQVPAADDAHLYLWATNPLLREAFDVVAAWGFTYRTTLTWLKTGALGMGFYFRGDTEHVLFATRGSSPIAAANRRRNWFHAQRTRHSVKPDAFYDLVEQVSPGPYLEIFARRARFGWDYAGDGSLGTVEIPGLRNPGEAAA